MKKPKNRSKPKGSLKNTPPKSPGKFWIIAGATLVAIGAAAWGLASLHKKPEKRKAEPPYVSRPPHSLTFNKDIAPIVFEHCAVCHRPGQAGPFPLLTYENVKKRAEQIVRVTESRYMPPWLPEPGYGDFVGERRLSNNDLGLLRQWASEGAAEGQASDLPPAPNWSGDWILGKPDLVLELTNSYTLAAGGKDVYRNFVLPVPIDQTRYVRGFEFQPTNPKIVHHNFILLDAGRESRKLDGRDGAPGFPGMSLPEGVDVPEGHFLGWQPGRLPRFDPDDMAWILPEKSDLVLQMHLRPSGKPEPVGCRVGLYFTDRPPTRNCFRLGLVSMMMDIPPGEQNYTVEDEFELPVDSQVIGILPHAHYLCKRMEGFAILPDGTKKWLLLIKNWDFNWQGNYQYAAPITLPKGAKLTMRYTYDNSTNNLQNPNNPPKRVQYGPQSSDEMAELWFQLLPASPEGMKLLVDADAAKSRVDLIKYYEYQLQVDPNNADVHTKLGFIRFLQGDANEGIRHLRQAIALAPQNDTAHYKLGLIYRYQKRSADAKAEFEMAIRLNPGNYDAHGNLGIIYAEEGNLTLAEQHLRSALNINPNDPVARDLLTELLNAKARRNK
jgi:hypothetical protein